MSQRLTRKRTKSIDSKRAATIPHLDDPNQVNYGHLKSSYAMANGSKSKDWYANQRSPNATLYDSLCTARSRSQELFRNDDIARAIIRYYRNNVIGKGIKFQSMIKSGDVLDKITNQRIENAWINWCKPKHCSVSQNLHFDVILRQILNAVLIDGEVFVRLVNRQTTLNAIPLQLQLIQSEYVPLSFQTNTLSKNNTWNLGIEHDQWGTPVRYAVYREHPGNFIINSPNIGQYINFIPAEEIIHIKLRSDELPNTFRGIPLLHSSALNIHDLGQYRGIEIVRARAASALMGFIEQDSDGYEPDPEVISKNDMLQSEQFMAGTFRALDPGSRLNVPHIQAPSNNYNAFVTSNSGIIGAGCSVPYAVVSGDYSKSNYSSSRLNRLDTEPTIQIIQQDLEKSFFDELYERWIELAVLKLQLSIDDKTLDDYNSYKIFWPSMKYIDPDKDVRSIINSINSGITSRTETLASRGIDINDHIEVLKKENELLEQAGLNFSQTPIGGQIEAPEDVTPQQTTQEDQNNVQSN